MVAYVKNNILLVVLLLLVVSSYARFTTKVTKSEISDICTHRGVNASFCFEFLKPFPEITKLDYSGLTKFLIIYESRITSDLLKHFQSLTNSTTDRSSKGSYKVCAGTFDLAVSFLDKALKSLATKMYHLVNIRISSTLSIASDCRDELSSVVKPIPQLIKGVSTVYEVSSIVLVILECYIRKEKEYC